MTRLKMAFDEYCNDICKSFPDDNGLEDFHISQTTEKRIFRRFRSYDNVLLKTFPRRIASAVAVMFLFFASVLSVRAVRDPVFDFVTETFDNITSVTFFGSKMEGKVDFVAVKPSYIPEGFSLVHSKTDDDSYDCVYQTGNAEKYIVYFQNIITPELRLEFDTKYTDAKKIYVGDYDGYLVHQKGNVTIVFFTDKYSFHISTNLSYYEANDIAFSITRSEIINVS